MQKWLLHCHLVACCQTNQSFVCWRPWWISRKRIASFNKPEQPFEAQKLLDKKTLQHHVAVALFIERFIKFSRNIHLNVYAGLRTQRDALLFKGTVFILELSNLPRARLLCDHWEIWVNCDSQCHNIQLWPFSKHKCLSWSPAIKYVLLYRFEVLYPLTFSKCSLKAFSCHQRGL